MMANPLLFDGTWLQQTKFQEAEAFYQMVLAGTSSSGGGASAQSSQQTPNKPKQSSNKQQGSTLKSEIAQARQNIQKALNEPGSTATPAAGAGDAKLVQRIKHLEDENNNLKKASQDLTSLVKKLEARVSALELSNKSSSTAAPAPAPAPADEADSDSDNLFGSDSDSSEDEETKAKLEAYKAKKAAKPKVIAKSSLLLDVKPWDDETDMKILENSVRSIVMDGLLWGASKLVPVGYGIKKLQIAAVIEDDKVSTDDLEEKITAFEDYIQSMDIAAFNKI